MDRFFESSFLSQVYILVTGWVTLCMGAKFSAVDEGDDVAGVIDEARKVLGYDFSKFFL